MVDTIGALVLWRVAMILLALDAALLMTLTLR